MLVLVIAAVFDQVLALVGRILLPWNRLGFTRGKARAAQEAIPVKVGGVV